MAEATSSKVAHAFGEGADARISGRPLSANPHTSGPLSDHLRRAWAEGWNHADRMWGRDSKWPHRPLPPVYVGSVSAE